MAFHNNFLEDVDIKYLAVLSSLEFTTMTTMSHNLIKISNMYMYILLFLVYIVEKLNVCSGGSNICSFE